VDLAQDVSNLGIMMAQSGYTVDGFAAQPGMSWQLVGMRNAQGNPIYQPNLQAGPGGSLYGYDLAEIKNGSWVSGASGAVILAGDFDKSIIGIRNDISFKMFTEGVVSDDAGKVILNLMQQDAVAMRMTMRLAYATVNPVTVMRPGDTITQRWPFAAILPVGATPPAISALNVVQAPPYPYTGSFMVEGTASEADLENETETDVQRAQEAAAEAAVKSEEEGRKSLSRARSARARETEPEKERQPRRN
jgi:hypothetical protein